MRACNNRKQRDRQKAPVEIQSFKYISKVRQELIPLRFEYSYY